MPATELGAATDFDTANMDVNDETVSSFLKGLMPEGASDDTKKKLPVSEETPAVEPAAKDDNASTADEDPADAPAKETPEAKDGDEEADATKTDKHDYASEGAYVKVKVGDEEHEVPVKDLQRLYGQEQALTKKSMEVAETRKTADAELAKNVAASTALLERAKARFEPFSKIDFLLAAKDLSAEDYTSLRAAATAAYEDVQFLQSNMHTFAQEAQTRQHESLITQAKESLKVLGGPVDQGGIEGWNEALYNDIRKFGISAGLKPEIVHNLVDAAAIRLLNDAMLYRKGASKVITQRVNKSPTKVIKTKTAPEANTPGDKTNVNKAAKKLRASGSTDDAAEMLMAGWASRDASEQ